MAKIPFSKLGLIKNQEVKQVSWNDQILEIKQYLPINDKLSLISRVVNKAHNEHDNHSNPVQTSVFTAIEIIYAYTNLSFTDKQKEDVPKLYDLFVGSGLYDLIINNIPEVEYNTIVNGVKESIEAIYNYQNSIVGILETISTDYSDLNFDASEIQQKLADPNNMELLKSVLSKLG